MTSHCPACGQSLSLERASFLRTLTAAAAWRERSLLAKLGVPGVESLTGEQVRDLCVAHFEAARVRYEPVMLDTNDGRWLDSHFGNVAFALNPAKEPPVSGVVRIPEESPTAVVDQVVAQAKAPLSPTDAEGPTAVGDVVYTPADLERARHVPRVSGRVSRKRLAKLIATVRAEATAAERERAAGKCEELADEMRREGERDSAWTALELAKKIRSSQA